MKGIEYIVDDDGKKRAAVIDLDVYGYLWEDIHDILVVESRKRDSRVQWEDVKRKRREGKHSRI